MKKSKKLKEKTSKKLKEKKIVKIESSVTIKQKIDYKNTFNPIYMEMTDEGLV